MRSVASPRTTPVSRRAGMSRAHWSETPSPRIAYRGSVKRLRQLSAALVVAAGALAPVAGAAGAPPPRTASGPASGPVHGLGQMGVAITTVTWAGYSIALPEAFAQRSAKNCFTDKGSFVIVGSYRALGGCMSLGPLSGTTVLLGQGGPVFSPIPAVFAGDQSFHGVKVQELVGTDAFGGTSFDTSYLLALLPGRDTWIYVGAPGAVPSRALTVARQIVATVRAVRPSGPGGLARSPRGSFIGSWHVHDAELTITSLRQGVISGRGDCSCEEVDTLSLSPSADGSAVNATVTAVGAIGVGGKRVADPHPNEVVGQKLFFEFIEPHLMLQVTVPNEPGDLSVSFGNPFWCGHGLAMLYTPVCGA